MVVSNQVVIHLEKYEGLILHPYRDSVGVWTIGFGSTMYETGIRVAKGDPAITEERAFKLMMWEVNNKAKSVDAFTHKVTLTQNQFDALVSLTYNIGVGNFETSTLLKKVLQNPNNPAIRDQFNRWVHGNVNGKETVLDALVRRRKEEADWYFAT